jgi:hypothetical protein
LHLLWPWPNALHGRRGFVDQPRLWRAARKLLEQRQCLGVVAFLQYLHGAHRSQSAGAELKLQQQPLDPPLRFQRLVGGERFTERRAGRVADSLQRFFRQAPNLEVVTAEIRYRADDLFRVRGEHRLHVFAQQQQGLFWGVGQPCDGVPAFHRGRCGQISRIRDIHDF